MSASIEINTKDWSVPQSVASCFSQTVHRKRMIPGCNETGVVSNSSLTANGAPSSQLHSQWRYYIQRTSYRTRKHWWWIIPHDHSQAAWSRTLQTQVTDMVLRLSYQMWSFILHHCTGIVLQQAAPRPVTATCDNAFLLICSFVRLSPEDFGELCLLFAWRTAEMCAALYWPYFCAGMPTSDDVAGP
jgi:hypothetical protein